MLVFLFKKRYNIELYRMLGDEIMQVSKEEILHIAKLADLNLKEEEVEIYMGHLEEILNFANVVSKARNSSAAFFQTFNHLLNASILLL